MVLNGKLGEWEYCLHHTVNKKTEVKSIIFLYNYTFYFTQSHGYIHCSPTPRSACVWGGRDPPPHIHRLTGGVGGLFMFSRDCTYRPGAWPEYAEE